MNKKFVPCIYLYHGSAVRSLTDHTVIDSDPVRLAQYYCENNADELIIFDGNEADDHLHDQALDCMKAICKIAEVDVIGAGNVKRMEDIKKILYTGCKKAILDYRLTSNIEITGEVSLKFGKDKLLAALDSQDIFLAQKQVLKESVSGLVLWNGNLLHTLENQISLPFYVHLEDISLNKLLTLLSQEKLNGITGNMINDNVKDILKLKDICSENQIPVERLIPSIEWSELKLNADGMIPVIVQDYKTSEVLMLAYMNEEAFCETLRNGKMTYYSRSRQALWLKGETSGHFQYVKELSADCDKDTLLAKVSQIGVACHTGAKSCFFQEIVKKDYTESSNPLKVFHDVFEVIQDRKIHPKEGSYTNYLFDKGIDKILKKLGEEATEIVIAAKNPNPNEIKYEISDFLYHMMVLMAEKNVSWEEITEELANR